MSNKNFRELIIENEKTIEEALINNDLLSVINHINNIKKAVVDSNADEPQKAQLLYGCAEFVRLKKKDIFDGEDLTDIELKYSKYYRISTNLKSEEDDFEQSKKFVKDYIESKYKVFSLEYAQCELSKIATEIGNAQKNIEAKRQKDKEKKFKRIQKRESINSLNWFIDASNIDERLIYSIWYNIFKYDIENTKKENENQKKTQYFLEWQNYVLNFLQINNNERSAFFIKNNVKMLVDMLKEATKENIDYMVILFLSVAFEPYNSILINSNNEANEDKENKDSKLSIKSNFVKDVLSEEYKIFKVENIKQVQEQIKKSKNRLSDKSKYALTLLAVFAITSASVIAPHFAITVRPILKNVIVNTKSAEQLKKVVINKNLGSLVVGSILMAGGTMSIVGSVAFVSAYSKIPSHILTSIMTKEAARKSCINCLALSTFLIKSLKNIGVEYSVKHIVNNLNSVNKETKKAIKEIQKNIKSLEKDIKKKKNKNDVPNLKKEKKVLESSISLAEQNIKFYEKTIKKIEKDIEDFNKKKNK